MKLKTFLIILISLTFSGIAISQENAETQQQEINIPAHIKQELIRRILVFKFKPAKRKRVVILAKNDIDPQWLPNIQNIEFRLLSDEEFEDRSSEIYFFSEITLENKVYNINFAFGDPDCDYSGEGWNFRVKNNKLKLWVVGRTGGGGGGGGENDYFEKPGKLNTYPNELEGYEFFDKGKLKGLFITVSSKEDIANIYGSDCDIDCDYDDNWKINFNYFGSFSKESTVNDKKIRYVPKKEIIGKIYSITLTPKKRLSFQKINFPRQFKSLSGFSVGHNFDSEGKFSAAAKTSYKTYLDRYGLEYVIYESGYTVGKTKKDKRIEGDLMSIKYTIPEKIEETTFVEEQ